MSIKKDFSWLGFSDGHPQIYHIMAIALAMVAMSTAVVTITLAEDGAISTNTTSTSTTTTTSPNSTAAATSTSTSTSGSTTTTSTSTSGSTSGTTTVVTDLPTCLYNYSNWGVCKPENKRYRYVMSKFPVGCVQRDEPKLTESCNYTSPTPTFTTTTNPVPVSAAVQCEYSYSSWSLCQSDGTRTRSFLSKSPDGCQEYIKPVLRQSCIYDATPTATTTTSVSGITTTTLNTTTASDSDTSQTDDSNTETNSDTTSAVNVTPKFSFENVSDTTIIQGDFEIKGSVYGAKEVAYFLVPTGSNTSKYIGIGSKISDTVWSLKFHSKGFPNGEFYLRAKIKNVYGEYIGGQRKIRIVNEGQSLTMENISSNGDVTLVMSNEEKTAILQKMEETLQMPKDASADATEKTLDQRKKTIINYCHSNVEACHPERDSDKDGLSDIDEIRYGTNPESADSDLDGFIDGDEVRNGFDPSKYSSGDKSDRIIFEDPKTSGEVKKEMYAVENIELKDTEKGEKKLHLSGKGLPNSFVTIYVYSDPIVLTVKTDADGNWTYDLDKELEDGSHEAYVAITDNTGKITAKSEPIAFVKTAQAATIIPSAQAAPEGETLPVTQNRTQRDLLFLIAIIIAAIAIALSTIGFIKHKRNAANEQAPQL